MTWEWFYGRNSSNTFPYIKIFWCHSSGQLFFTSAFNTVLSNAYRKVQVLPCFITCTYRVFCEFFGLKSCDLCDTRGVVLWNEVPFKLGCLNNLVKMTGSPVLFSSPLVSYIARTWHPSSSVSKARFVTTGSISMKLGVRIPLGNTPRPFFDFLDLTYFVAYISTKPKQTKSYYSWTNGWITPNFNHGYIYLVRRFYRMPAWVSSQDVSSMALAISLVWSPPSNHFFMKQNSTIQLNSLKVSLLAHKYTTVLIILGTYLSLLVFGYKIIILAGI
jgi:hypothetical protein